MSRTWKSPFEHLALRRCVLRDVDNPLNTERQPYRVGVGPNANRANLGESWNAERLRQIFTTPGWLRPLQRATGVVMDNAPAHKKLVEDLKEMYNINIIAHPPSSPDMNVIERMFAVIKDRNAQNVREARNNEQLLAAYKANFEAMDPRKCMTPHLQNYIKTCRDIVASRGRAVYQ